MKRFIWLVGVWIIKILFAPRNMKVSFFKSLYFNIFGGFTSDQVVLYNLNRSNKKEYLSEFDWYKSRKINGKHSIILNNKIKFSKLIKDYINVPEIYFIKEKGKYYFSDYKETELKECIKMIKEQKSVFLKPISKGKGIGVKKVEYKEKVFYINLKPISNKKLYKILQSEDNYFFSQTINQADYLNDIYDKTSNTIRIITVREKKEIKVLYAVQRFGDKNTIPVDNGSMGGLVSKIDLETGKLSEARSIKNKNIYKKHPDSRKKIKNRIIPDFNNIKDVVINLMDKIPDVDFIAWDLLMTNNDIYVLEANSSSGVNIIQVFGGQRNNVLGNYYRSKKIIK